MADDIAFGKPGIPPRWTSSAKDGIGTAFTAASRVWFTHSHGILNECYYPSVDTACTRDFQLLVANGRDFFSEEKRHTTTHVDPLVPGVPAFKITNHCVFGNFSIEKELFTDPVRDVVLQSVRFLAPAGRTGDFHLYALLAPHLANRGSDNTARVTDYKGIPILAAERQGMALALAASPHWLRRSVGFVGFSDGWVDLQRHKRMTWEFTQAQEGNVALTGELPLPAEGSSVFLALGFGRSIPEAAHRAVASLNDDLESMKQRYVQEWQDWQAGLADLREFEPAPPITPVTSRKRRPVTTTTSSSGIQELYRVSTAVMRCHEDKRFPGGIIASLSIPWGFSKGDEDLGGYHLTWPRDLCETAGGLLAAGALEDARRVLNYLQTTQEEDGHWAQNLWLDGRPYWNGIQLDETALPILLVDLARREGALDASQVDSLWPMVRRAASFIACNGPVTQQDRWEEDGGYSPFTLSTEIAALLVAAQLADEHGEAESARYLRDTADVWYDSIDRWMYATGTELSAELGVDGYYVRMAPPQTSNACSPLQGFVAIKNRPPDQSFQRAANTVSPDALALVRFGLRHATDRRILDTVRVIDHLVRVELPQGPAWHRYNQDGYGEHDDGSPFDGTGVGRPWPLLTGERAHWELAAGHLEEARRLQQSFRDMANDSGFLPEQTWDADDIPERELFRGRPAGSAMPLVWAHAEYVKLLRSLQAGSVFDMPQQTVERYLVARTGSSLHAWRFNQRCREMQQGRTLRLETRVPAVVHWSCDHWQSTQDTATRDSGVGMHAADLPTGTLPAGNDIDFTFYWPGADRWEGVDFQIHITDQLPAAPMG